MSAYRITMLYKDWFDRCEGSWRSHRRYLAGPKRSIDNLITEFTHEIRGDGEYAVVWESDRNTGEMGLLLDEANGNVIRSRNYFESTKDEGGTVTRLERIDEDTVVFYSSYGGADYREEIRFLDDNNRLRQTVGCKEGTDRVFIVGQYYEERI